MNRNLIILGALAVLVISLGMTVNYCSDKSRQEYKDQVDAKTEQTKDDTRKEIDAMADSIANSIKP